LSLTHWNYFLAVEQDTIGLSRYVEFSTANFSTYSVEIARLLMTATQDIDVLAKQVCDHHGNNSHNERGYRAFLPGQYPNLCNHEVVLSRFDITVKPFSTWAANTTPTWWTANNKVKHERHTQFSQASLENLVNAISGLYLMNLYYYDSQGTLGDIWPGPQLLICHEMVKSVSPTAFGTIPNFEIP
jgi:hypothetical protein